MYHVLRLQGAAAVNDVVRLAPTRATTPPVSLLLYCCCAFVHENIFLQHNSFSWRVFFLAGKRLHSYLVSFFIDEQHTCMQFISQRSVLIFVVSYFTMAVNFFCVFRAADHSWRDRSLSLPSLNAGWLTAQQQSKQKKKAQRAIYTLFTLSKKKKPG